MIVWLRLPGVRCVRILISVAVDSAVAVYARVAGRRVFHVDRLGAAEGFEHRSCETKAPGGAAQAADLIFGARYRVGCSVVVMAQCHLCYVQANVRG